MRLIIPLLLISSLVYCEEKPKVIDMTPTEAEGERLSKLKERVLKTRSEQETLEAQIIALQAQRRLKQIDVNNAIGNLNNEAENVKKAHKDWGESNKIDYQAEDKLHEWGNFVAIPLTQDEKNLQKEAKPNVSEKNNEKEGQKEGRKIEEKKPKK